MEIIIFIILVIIVVLIIGAIKGNRIDITPSTRSDRKIDYTYSRKDTVMTITEASFYHRLETIVDGKYYIFPQIHLSTLLNNQTKGKYWKAAFQWSNRSSVDYVLCDKQTMRPVYVVELDDTTHDSAKTQDRDAKVVARLSSVGLPLVRFRNVANLTDDQIAQRFQEAAGDEVADQTETQTPKPV